MEIIINGDKIRNFGTHAGYALTKISEVLEKHNILPSKFFNMIYLLENYSEISGVTLDVYTRSNAIDIILNYKDKRLYFKHSDDEEKKESIKKEFLAETLKLSRILTTQFVAISIIDGGGIAYPKILNSKQPMSCRFVFTGNN